MSNEEERSLLIEALRNPLRDLTMGQHGPGPADETVADALLPVVDRIARERAAEELRAAGKELWNREPAQMPVEQLADRARARAALDRQAAILRGTR